MNGLQRKSFKLLFEGEKDRRWPPVWFFRGCKNLGVFALWIIFASTNEDSHGSFYKFFMPPMPVLDVESVNQMELPFYFKRKIGRGNFGVVWEGENRETGEIRALKLLPKGSKVSKAEGAVMNKLPHHLNVVQMEGSFDIESKFCVLVLELCDTDLKRYMAEKGGKLDEEEARLVMRGITKGIKALRDSNIFHRDLKTENILLTFSPDGQITPKVADFGLARVLRRPDELFHSFCGSPLYFAPEIWAQSGYTMKADIYSCGVLLYEMITGSPPFSFSRNKLQLRRLALHSGIPSEDFDLLPLEEEGRVLMKRLLEREVAVRIDWEELFAHPWLCKC